MNSPDRIKSVGTWGVGLLIKAWTFWRGGTAEAFPVSEKACISVDLNK